MITSKTVRPLVAVATLAALGLSGQAFAQAATASTPLAGPVVPGVCILSNDRLIGNSAVGKYVLQRMQQLDQAVRTELQPESTSIQNEGRNLATQKVAQTDPRWTALQTKAQAFERKAQQRTRELQATQQKALARIATEADSVIRAIYTQKNCGLLLDRAAVFGANAQMDITDQAVTGLNAKISQFAFERERLDAPQAAARPATPAPVKK